MERVQILLKVDVGWKEEETNWALDTRGPTVERMGERLVEGNQGKVVNDGSRPGECAKAEIKAESHMVALAHSDV